jgi:hypothetical protein
MATNFPTSVDNFTNPTANDSLNLPSHSTQHANANDAIEAIEGYLLNGGQGLTHLNSTNFTASSGVAINNVFTSTYQSYKIILSNLVCISSSQTVFIKLRASGVNSSTGYYSAGFFSYTPGSVLGFTGAANDSTVAIATANSTHRTGAIFELQNPQLTVATGFQGSRAYWDGANVYGFGVNGVHLPTTSYDGFEIYPNSSTISGTVSVFGYRNS